MYNIHYSQTDETILFAVEELRRLILQAGYEASPQLQSEWSNHKKQLPRINLITASDYQKVKNHKEILLIQKDGFAIVRSSKDTWIIGNEPRALLYGAYSYMKQQFGYRFVMLDSEEYGEPPLTENLYIHEPMFTRRGTIIETINNPTYINSLIDWGVKNGQNECFFTFFLWDELKPHITDALKKRGVQVTLGGHSLSYLLRGLIPVENESNSHPVKNLTFFSEHSPLQQQVIERIVAICQENEVVTRISLWPEDIGVDRKTSVEFLQNYIRFTEKLREAFVKQKMAIEVEYIVYNAGLAWNMLERDGTKASSQVDGLYAYWGRDYSTGIHSEEPNQQRAYNTLQDWRTRIAEKGRTLTVLEYYSDHFMLSELFPPLMNRIEQDLKEYKQLGVSGVLNLIVPIHKKPHDPDQKWTYPWKWIHHMNNYVYLRLAWGESFETVMEEYFDLFDQERESFHQMLRTLEKLIAAHTKWNVPLFPARVVDPEKVKKANDIAQIVEDLRQIQDYVSSLDLTQIESLLPLHHEDQFFSLTPNEMMLVYVYYVKTFSETYLAEWESKLH
ncbi:alpha-glucuronidase family glycosyl hydrolase [Paenisporosarcina sp.]|uniref:alpha-glucuronidase family glycosyl hydrolase n=1 Tax=Paenisporosarcina sp. TaxID=1932001 RepID=UPI003C748A68